MLCDVLLTLTCVFAVSSGQEGRETWVPRGATPIGADSNPGFDLSPLHLTWNQVRVCEVALFSY